MPASRQSQHLVVVNRSIRLGVIVRWLLLLLCVVLVGGGNLLQGTGRPQGWKDETHGRDAEPDYDRVFATDRVNRLDIAMSQANWARVMAQIVYYVVAAERLGRRKGGRLAFTVPTGNFGNVFAGYASQAMGLPISRFVVASNRNDILTSFFTDGTMTIGEVHPTLSPSMDIQVSSNLERLLFELHEHSGEPAKGKKRSRSKNAPRFDAREQLFKMCGVDVTRIDGIDVSTALTIVSETGTDLSRFASDKLRISDQRDRPFRHRDRRFRERDRPFR